MNHRFRVLTCLLVGTTFSHAQAPGQHNAAGRDITLQKESDWADARWSRTEIGPFLASNLELSGGAGAGGGRAGSGSKVAKGLSIKIGANAEGTVCYDTATGVLRGGWLGGFVKLDPARFGLISAPRANGPLVFNVPSADGWGQRVQYRGLHVRGPRVVLEYAVGDRKVLDSPWLETTNDLKIFTRSLDFAPAPGEMQWVVTALGNASDISVKTQAERGLVTARVEMGEMKSEVRSPKSEGLKPESEPILGIALLGAGAGAELREEQGKLLAKLPSQSSRRAVKLLYWKGPRAEWPKFAACAEASRANGPEDLKALLAQTPVARWLPELKTSGQRGLDTSILSTDTLTLPYDNPWKALLFLAGVDFTPDGAGYVCSIHGDVWRVTGVDDTLRELKWKRFATGLFQPLGLKVRDGQVFVLGRDQITRLHDENHDGEADFYENFCNLIETSTNGHDFVTSLEKDNSGNFYYVSPRGVFRVSPDGLRQDKLASGFRNPNGLGASPDSRIITVAPQQGEWTPSSLIAEIKLGGHYGYGGPRITPERPLGYDPPFCWLPHSVDNSSGSQVWVPAGVWGPLGGQMLHLLWGRCGLMLTLRDSVDGQAQGAVVPLPGRFLSGPNRGSFNPRDGHLYVACSTGWQTSAVKDGALHRVRFSGKPVYLPIGWHAYSNGLSLTFSQPLARATAEDPGSYALQQWNYRYAAQYGSKDWSVAEPKQEGRDNVEVKSARLLPDGRTVFLELPGLRPVMQMEVKYNLDAADGNPIRGPLWLTLNRLDQVLR